MAEVEGKGVDYERYALGKLFARLARDYAIDTVLELPAGGEKAMPALYSLGFAAAGCRVTLVNAEEKSRPAWLELGLNLAYWDCAELTDTGLDGDGYDLVWNFMCFAQCDKREALLKEMLRLSRRFVLFVAVNKYNPGFYCHRLAHKLFGAPWTHGNVDFMSPFFASRYLSERGIKVLKTGAVDCPPYPDSVGFRDMRLHRRNVNLNKIDWESRTIRWMKTGRYPLKIRLMYLFEMLPLPFIVKLAYAHLFYVLAEK